MADPSIGYLILCAQYIFLRLLSYFPPALFHFSIWLTLQQVALEHGLILVDTKYEFGKANDGSIMLIDEVQCYP